MKTTTNRLVPLFGALVLAACGADDGATRTASQEPSEEGRPAVQERSYKAYDDLSKDLDEGNGAGLNVYGTSEEPRYRSYQPGYNDLWRSIAIRPDRVGTVDWYVNQIVRNKDRYMKVQENTGVPWFWVGITHGLEGSFNFSTHLHNGDPLSARTVQVPAGRPTTGRAPFTWEFSAFDAINMKGYPNWRDWHLPSILAYSFERYNGFGYRNKGVNSPYLWSFSYHYSRGKYTADGYYDPYAVSQQAGAMVVLKRGLDRGVFVLFDPKAQAPQPSETALPDVVRADAKPPLDRLLSSGVQGRDVLLLKMRLRSYGFYSGALTPAFDASTVTAVRAAQRFHGLADDGVVGQGTWGRLWPSLSEASWFKAWNTGGAVDLRSMSGTRCVFRVLSKEAPALVPFLKASEGAATISFGGESAKATDMPGACPDVRESYDLKNAAVVPAPSTTAPWTAPGTNVTWHKLYAGAQGEWILNSYAGGTYVTALSTRVKADLVAYLERHAKAHNVVPALNGETPVR